MPDIYINTERPIDRAIVAGINQPQREAPIGAFTAGSSYDVNLYFVKNDGTYDAASGDAGASVQVAISTLGKPQSGTFTLTDGVDTTSAIEYGASALEVQTALNALNGGAGAFSNQVAVEKVNDQQYAVTFATLGAVAALSSSTVSLYPESTPTASIAVAGSATTNAQQIIDITRQPAVYDATWSTIANGFTGTLALNTTRLLQSLLIDAGLPFYIEVKLNGGTVAKEVIGIEPSTMPASAFSATGLATLLDSFAANPTTNAFFSPANWRDDLSLVVGEDVQAWSTNLDEMAARMSWNNQEKTFDIVTGSDNVTIQVGQEVVLYARNTSGLQMTDGQIVKVVGSQGNNPTISLAQSDTIENARGVIGVVTQIIDNNSNGFVSLIGKVRDVTLDAGTYTEGDLLYLSSTVAGGFTKVRPDIIVEIGRVIATSSGGNNAGIIEVNIDNDSSVYELEQQLLIPINDNTTAIGDNTTAIGVNAAAIAALPFVGSFMAPDYSYSTNSNALAAGFVENKLFLNTTSHNLSAVYSDNYTLLAQYSGASAAYSLRRLSSNTTSALKIRRTGDNEEVDVLFDSSDQVSLQSPVSPTTFGTTLDEFVNTEIVTYTSDFSAGTDGWSADPASSATATPDPVGTLDVLQYTIDTETTAKYLSLTSLNVGQQYLVQAEVYIPSSNVDLDSIVLMDGAGFMATSYLGIQRDEWVAVSTVGTANIATINIRGASGTTASAYNGFQGNGTDVFYVRNVVITQTSSDGHVVTWYDQSGNGYDAVQLTASNQPKIVDAGVLVADRDGKVALNGKGANLDLPNDVPMLSSDGTFSVFTVCDLPDQTQGTFNFNSFLLFNSATVGGAPSTRKPQIYLGNDNGEMRASNASFPAGTVSASKAETIAAQLITNIGNPSLLSANNTLYFDGALVDFADNFTDINTDTTTGSDARLFQPDETTVETFLSEVIYYPSDESAKRVAIEANINNHYFPIA